ncbi:peptidoglycan-binding protein [Streptomyces sp. NPDC018693]|uniref:peptidoglycan-binding domain-containing protein n=1 Tax=unclassified Streptomyces TaxID=2593676 RepID=UPI0037A827E0
MGAAGGDRTAEGDVEVGHHPHPAARNRLLALVALAMATLTAATLAAVLLYDSPSHSTAPDNARAPIPNATYSPGTLTPTAPSPSASSPAPSPSQSGTPAPSPTTATPTTPSQSTDETSPTDTPTTPPPTDTTPTPPPTLRPGDTGPEVTELQLRLRQIGFYYADADGTYDSDVENAVRSYQFTRVVLSEESGVYGPATRASLESETEEP